MKKRISLILILVFTLTLFAGCGGSNGVDAGNNTTPPTSATPGNSAAPAQKSDLLLWLPPFGTGDSLDKEFWSKTLAPWAEENNVNLSIEIK